MEYLVKSVIKGTQRVMWVYELYFCNEKIQVPGKLLNQIIKKFLRCNNWLTGISLAQRHQVDWWFHKGTTDLWKLFSACNYEAPQLIFFPLSVKSSVNYLPKVWVKGEYQEVVHSLLQLPVYTESGLSKKI